MAVDAPSHANMPYLHFMIHSAAFRTNTLIINRDLNTKPIQKQAMPKLLLLYCIYTLHIYIIYCASSGVQKQWPLLHSIQTGSLCLFLINPTMLPSVSLQEYKVCCRESLKYTEIMSEASYKVHYPLSIMRKDERKGKPLQIDTHIDTSTSKSIPGGRNWVLL